MLNKLPPLMSVKAFAERINVSRANVYKWIQFHGMPHLRIGRTKAILLKSSEAMEWLKVFCENKMENCQAVGESRHHDSQRKRVSTRNNGNWVDSRIRQDIDIDEAANLGVYISND